ncbi:MAG: class I SAM-dependent methyltransferase [Phycisphaerales bacterium]
MARVECRLCGSETSEKFRRTVMARHDVGYHECATCGSLMTDAPTWLDEAYNAPFRGADTGAVLRAQMLQVALPLIARATKLPKDAKVLDFGAGDGLLVRMLRDVGMDAYHADKYVENVYAAPFDFDPAQKYAMITAFEVYEHLPNPAQDIEAIFSLDPDVHVITTQLYRGQGADWDYLSVNSGRHVFFWSPRALRLVGEKRGYQVRSFPNQISFFHKRPISGPASALLSFLFKKGAIRRPLLQAFGMALRDRRLIGQDNDLINRLRREANEARAQGASA